jgi:mannose-6-phosphate isomerase-like protein (cupin superfamily)
MRAAQAIVVRPGEGHRVEGTMTFVLGDGDVPAPPGTFVLAPAGVPHGFRNEGEQPVRMLNVHVPGGFDRRIGLEG